MNAIELATAQRVAEQDGQLLFTKKIKISNYYEKLSISEKNEWDIPLEENEQIIEMVPLAVVDKVGEFFFGTKYEKIKNANSHFCLDTYCGRINMYKKG